MPVLPPALHRHQRAARRLHRRAEGRPHLVEEVDRRLVPSAGGSRARPGRTCAYRADRRGEAGDGGQPLPRRGACTACVAWARSPLRRGDLGLALADPSSAMSRCIRGARPPARASGQHALPRRIRRRSYRSGATCASRRRTGRRPQVGVFDEAGKGGARRHDRVVCDQRRIAPGSGSGGRSGAVPTVCRLCQSAVGLTMGGAGFDPNSAPGSLSELLQKRRPSAIR